MPLILRSFVPLSAALLATLAVPLAPAYAKQVCGWYAIAYCNSSKAETIKFANRGWGAVIHSNDYAGLTAGYFCAASGPQPRDSALRDQKNARTTGVSSDTYIKRACTDAANIGD